MQLRPIERRDLEIARRLRNENRDAFLDNREISPEQQQTWFEGLAAMPVRFFVIEDAGVVVGTISITDRGAFNEMGNITLDTASRGRGLMRAAIDELTRAPGQYFAEVKCHNEPSLRAFRATGFAPVSQNAVVRLERIVRV